MRAADVLAFLMIVLLISFGLFPDEYGRNWHKIYNKFMAGWESVK